MEGYSLYEHVFPDGKRYIGVSKDPKKRWKQDGSGYISNQPMWEAIKKYGWNKIKHKILASGLSREEARQKEREAIEEADSINNGYNQKPGGQLSTGYYSKHVRKMIANLKKYKWLDPDFLPTHERLVNLENDECWACELNYVDAMMRNETDGYIHGMAMWYGEEMYEVMDWYFYLKQYTLHPEIDFRNVKNKLVERLEEP